jgi:predicted DNA-binding WGR domain protein
MSVTTTTYLELSESGGGAHKFYEVTVQGKEVKIRFGRIGDAGQTTSKKYPSEDRAKADADKKIKEKLNKGYEHAVMGVRKKRSVTRRPMTSSPSTAKQAPVLWKFDSGDPALGIFIDDQRCWVGNQGGKVFALDHDARVLMQFQLPDGVKCIVADALWVYAGCDDGNVYDLTGKIARLAYEIAEDVNIYWLDISGGILAVSDDESTVTIIDPEGEKLWSRTARGGQGWMVRCDARGVYHGHGSGVDAYTLKIGKPLWQQKKADGVLFGWQTAKAVYASGGHNAVHAIDKKTGKVTATYQCDGGAPSCASTTDGKYVFAGDFASSVYCFEAGGKRLWKLGTGCGTALSMQFWKDRLYLVTSDGSLACIDAGEKAIRAAEAGTVPTARQIKAPRAVAAVPTTTLDTTSDKSKGVEVDCVPEGSKLRVHVVSPGYHRDWNVQFPRDLREKGAHFMVEQVHEAAGGGFYRAHGEIKKLV